MNLILCKLRHVTIRINPTFIPFPAPRIIRLNYSNARAPPNWIFPKLRHTDDEKNHGRQEVVHASSSSSPIRQQNISGR